MQVYGTPSSVVVCGTAICDGARGPTGNTGDTGAPAPPPVALSAHLGATFEADAFEPVALDVVDIPPSAGAYIGATYTAARAGIYSYTFEMSVQSPSRGGPTGGYALLYKNLTPLNMGANFLQAGQVGSVTLRGLVALVAGDTLLTAVSVVGGPVDFLGSPDRGSQFNLTLVAPSD